MSIRKDNYPSKTRRNALITAVAGFKHDAGKGRENKSRELIVAGRVIGILDGGLVLQDESGRMEIIHDGKVNAGDIVEAAIEPFSGNDSRGREVIFYRTNGLTVLAPCRADFFIRKSDPNWKKLVIDCGRRDVMARRVAIVRKIREFFWGGGFMEAETPEMVRLPGMEPYLDPFKTSLTSQPVEGARAREEDMYLITSPEYALKKLLAAGYEKVFQLSKSFRNRETAGTLHNPEFTMLEWYRAYADYGEIMKDTENLVNFLAREVCGGETIVYGKMKIDTKPPWPKISVKDVFRKYAGIDEETMLDESRLRDECRKRGYKTDAGTPYEDAFFLIFMNEIEAKLGLEKPTIVFDYPARMGALSKKKKADPRYAERFELYIAGVELCNAYTELNDPAEQGQRLEEERVRRIAMGKDNYPVDQSFMGALEFGMPPAGGNALGVDRLAMVLTDTHDINDIMFFPLRDL